MDNIVFNSLKYCVVFFSFILASSVYVIADEASVSGRITNSGSGEAVPFINVMVEGTTLGTFTNDEGQYTIAGIPSGSHNLQVAGMGFRTHSVSLELQAGENKNIDLEVEPDALQLEVVRVTASPTASGFRYQSDLGFVGEDLQKRSEASFGEMLDGEPGLAMRSNGSAPARPVIRGMGDDRILILEHGERMGDVSESGSGHSLTMDPLSANRVEVVKGPASLMYGSSALGGVINLMTADIPEDWEQGSTGVVSAQGATVNSMGAGFARYTHGNSNWAATGRIAYRGAGNLRTPEGLMPGTYMDNYDAAAGFGFNRSAMHGGFSLSANNQVYGLPEHLDDPDESVEVRQQRYGLQGRFSFDRDGFFDKAQLRIHTTHLRQEEIEIEYEDGILDEDLELYHDKYAFSSTLTLQHEPRGPFDRGAVGFNLHGHNLDIGGDEAYTPGERRANFGMFTYQEIPLTTRFRLQAGLRADVQYTAALSNEVFPDASQSRSTVNLTGSAGMNFRPGDSWQIGGQVARAHRNPMVEELFANGPHLCSGVYEIGSADLKDEIGHGADLFVEWTSPRWSVELSGFVNQFSNYIIFEPTGAVDDLSALPVFHYIGDEARFLGGEFVSVLQLTPALSSSLTIDYVHARRTGQDRAHLPFIPPLRLKTELEYDLGNVWVNVNVRAISKQDRVASEESVTDGYTLFGMAAGYRLDYSGRHVLMLRVDNMMDTKYRDHLSRVEDRQFPMPGRNISLAYRYYFH